ncbi:MAG: hypothetical protein NC079_00585 [Clostridium sp.]|nr:hypothetical protein [Acetatifactor muris]MCM1527467.1 hypothetical protein [Bacteroides sp.]MCM1562087.1 hypothetical protein [Clostridium sp.]
MQDQLYYVYSIDTAHFYSNREQNLHDRIRRYRCELLQLRDSRTKVQTEMSPAARRHWENLTTHKKAKIRETKEKMLTLLSHKVSQNERTAGRDHIRSVRDGSLKDTDIVSVFDSYLSRAIGIGRDELTDALMIVQVYYFDIFKDIAFHGFMYAGERYRYFTSSAGQIRKKKAVFIKETVWNRIESSVMCGLTIDRINSRGGNNVNKHLAYMALTNSATTEWRDFDIDRTIVVDDFETNVYGTFDFVDETDYSITRKSDYIPIPHTDGAGMMLPYVSDKNFMFRAPWIKGLLGVFDFRKFVTVNDCSPVITDLYGREHNIIEEDIRIIFTKSQFKMYRYYDSWDEYKDCFKKYHCRAGICNREEQRGRNAKINYQMLQTLTDVTDEEVDLITRRSSERIRNICNSRETMIEILGITPYNTDMTAFQKSVKMYPALLNDTYTKDMIRDIKNSLVQKYRSGRLEINGKYAFLLPDFYAACEHWFGHAPQPKGLLADHEVFCRMFRRHPRLDCLRSPHLYKEHAIRINAACVEYGERADRIGEWFTTDGLYASTHDLISKILMYDVDGDKALVVADEDFIRVAERNMKGIVPLYYNMRKSEPTPLTPQTIYDGLYAAFTGGNIGTYSNSISKIWNHEVFLSGSEKEKREALDCVRQLCCQNNFVIDFAKTLYKPEFPREVRERIAKYTQAKLPAFFAYAKDKEDSQLQARNGSLVNRIYDRIPNSPINTRSMDLAPLDHRNMMCNKTMVCSREVADLYDSLNRQYRYMINRKDEYIDNLHYIAGQMREQFHSFGYSDETVTDMLVEYLYGRQKRYKQLLWFCYGQYIVNNLTRNISIPQTKFVQCEDCGEWFEVDLSNRRTRRCPHCRQIHDREYERAKKQRQRHA